MNTVGRTVGALLCAVVVLAASLVAAQTASPPLRVTLALDQPPPNAVYAPGAPVMMRLQVQNISGAMIPTTEGFKRTEFQRQLVFTDANGMKFGATNPSNAYHETQTGYCFSRSRRLITPTALPVVPLEVLEATYGQAQEYVFDARLLYDLRRAGRYSVHAVVPLIVYALSNPPGGTESVLITDCDQFDPGTQLVNVAATGAVPGRVNYSIVSNDVEFSIGTGFTFGGFAAPLIADAACAPKFPCQTVRLGRPLPIKFKLFNESNLVVTNAKPHIALDYIASQTEDVPDDLDVGRSDGGNLFRYDPATQQYIFNLDTKVLWAGVWRIDVLLDDGSVHSIHVGLK